MQLGSIELTLPGLQSLLESLAMTPTLKPFQLRLMFMQDNAFKQVHQFAIWSRLMMPLNAASNLKEEDGRRNNQPHLTVAGQPDTNVGNVQTAERDDGEKQ